MVEIAGTDRKEIEAKFANVFHDKLGQL